MRVLILNQAFHPDVVSTAQHAADLATALAERGDEVTVIASRRGYDDPSRRFPRAEMWRGVRVRRVGGSGLGKRARWSRAVDFSTFLAACIWRLLWLPRQDVVIALTSPPLISFIAALFVPWKAKRLVFWCMDLNPDEAIAAGWLRESSIAARVLNRMLHFSLRRAASVVALDNFMAARLASKGTPPENIVVLPPWAHDDVRFDQHGREQFRAEHGLADKFVVMYSGNHSPCHPLQTLLDAATALRDRREICFCFVGGGSEMATVKQVARSRRLQNVICLPYQPREKLAASLSSADLHVVVMGNDFVGIVHPCKIYNVLSLGAPVLYIGPKESHVTELIKTEKIRAYSCRHGGGNDAKLAIEQAHHARAQQWHGFSNSTFSKRHLLPQMVRVVHGERAATAGISTNSTPSESHATVAEPKLAVNER